MKNFNSLGFTLVMATASVMSSLSYAGAEDDPLLSYVAIDQLEKGLESDDPISFSFQAWVGYDMDKIWLKTSSEYQNSDDQGLEVQALYSHAVAPYWDMQMGVRRDIKPSPSRDWLVLGFQGLAPYFFDIDGAFFVGEKGQTSIRLSIEQEWLITQKLILTPEFEMNAYGKSDDELSMGAGLTDINAGLRLKYEITRKFAPYIGIDWSKKLGATADLARDNGDSISNSQFVIGVTAWF
ncbi:Copper resistance protein B precursor [Marinomonas spartinae]|uniref:Copper resistance protein B n=1 Tax=Marinomonas spartinae TaxID=1792290 RepID=A0A1A8T9M0_9GAMM|nr:copper resistance protein B [Marinomonas spartinae]SBS29168.1 Copper resistance protein B precursor [Marinomonas spartinae]